MKPSFLIVSLLFILALGPNGNAQQKPKGSDRATTTKATVTEVENGELTFEGIAQNRSLSVYQLGGHIDCRRWSPNVKPYGKCAGELNLRDFIWNHWSKQERGYIRITFDSPDAKSTSHIFIEPDEGGNWAVIWRIARLHALPGGGGTESMIFRDW